MKQFLVLLFVVVVAACSTLKPAEKAEQQAKMAQAVAQALAERHYKVSVNMMFPRRGKPQNISPDFSLEVKGDTLVSYLPYFGRAYSVPYGGGKGLNFTVPIAKYQTAKGRKGATLVSIKVKNEEDTYLYHLEIFDNGNTSIDLTAHERESISYSGRMDSIDQ